VKAQIRPRCRRELRRMRFILATVIAPELQPPDGSPAKPRDEREDRDNITYDGLRMHVRNLVASDASGQ
ncbi:MAG: hypothetical protein M3Y69_04170, partial [Verrucomicrobiota bacterium]|nr:hypothetical protein [Verrucomicrobiota bacterium]